MKKLLGAFLVFGALSVLPSHFAKAAVLQGIPDGLFGLGDPNTQISYYDINSVWKYYCFTGQCYDIATDKLAFVKDVQPAITDLQNKVNNLQNQVSQLQVPAPVVQQTSATPIVSGNNLPSLLPAYTEDDLKGIVWYPTQPNPGIIVKSWYFQCVANSSTTARCNGSGIGSNQITFKFNDKIVGDCSKDFCGANPDHYVSISDLTPATTYTYQIIYSENGRQDSIFTKSFTTPAN